MTKVVNSKDTKVLNAKEIDVSNSKVTKVSAASGSKVLKVFMITKHQAEFFRKHGSFDKYVAPPKQEAYTISYAGDPSKVTGINKGTAPVPDPNPADPDTIIPTPVAAGSKLDLQVGYQGDKTDIEVLGVSFHLVDKVSLKEVQLKSSGNPTKKLQGGIPVEDAFQVAIPSKQPKGFYYLRIEMLYKVPNNTAPNTDIPYMPLIEIT